MQDQIRIWSLPDPSVEKNPYFRLLYDALYNHGLTVYTGAQITSINTLSLPDNCGWIHLHWPEHVVRAITPPVLHAARHKVPGLWRLGDRLDNYLFPLQVHRLKKFLQLARRANMKLCWTVHNTKAHENFGRRELQAYKIVAELSDLKVFHSRSAREAYISLYGAPGNSVVIPHGNYKTAYPESHPSDAVRKELNLDSKRPVFGLIGALREYKGLDLVLECVERTESSFQFLIAGSCSTEIKDKLDRDRRISANNIRLVARGLSDQEYADYINACDAILLPYKAATTSGALMAALTFGKGVIVSPLAAFTDIIGDKPDVGIVLKENTSEALLQSLHDYFDYGTSTRRQAALSLADDYDWSNVVKPLADAMLNISE